MKNTLVFISYSLTAMASICFVGGIAVLSGGKEKRLWGI